MAAAAMQDDFRLTSEAEIDELLQRLLSERALVSLSNPQGQHCATLLRATDRARGIIVLDAPLDRLSLEQSQASGEVQAVAYLDSIKLQFEVESPMLKSRMAACSTGLSERIGTRAGTSLVAEALRSSACWIEGSFISTYPLFNDFGHTFRIILGQHLQMLDLHFQPRAGRGQANFGQRVKFTQDIGRTIATKTAQRVLLGAQRQGRLHSGGD